MIKTKTLTPNGIVISYYQYGVQLYPESEIYEEIKHNFVPVCQYKTGYMLADKGCEVMYVWRSSQKAYYTGRILSYMKKMAMLAALAGVSYGAYYLGMHRQDSIVSAPVVQKTR